MMGYKGVQAVIFQEISLVFEESTSKAFATHGDGVYSEICACPPLTLRDVAF
jgi:hypothetical protein